MKDNKLETFQALLYKYCQITISSLVFEKESSAYGACKFKINELQILYRISRITPTKIGQFVVVWKRSENKIIAPYSLKNNLDYYIISTQKSDSLGYFIFPSRVLFAQNIIANQYGEGGKRGFRVYPSWDKPNNEQAVKSQNWQANYFFNCSNIDLIDSKKVATTFDSFFSK